MNLMVLDFLGSKKLGDKEKIPIEELEEFLDGKLKGWGVKDPELFWAEKSLEKTEELLNFKKMELSNINRDKVGGN